MRTGGLCSLVAGTVGSNHVGTGEHLHKEFCLSSPVVAVLLQSRYVLIQLDQLLLAQRTICASRAGATTSQTFQLQDQSTF